MEKGKYVTQREALPQHTLQIKRHFISSCGMLTLSGRPIPFGACFALLQGFCFGAMAGLVTKCCDCREGSRCM